MQPVPGASVPILPEAEQPRRSTINVRLATVRRLSYKAADTGLLSREPARRVSTGDLPDSFAVGKNTSGEGAGTKVRVSPTPARGVVRNRADSYPAIVHHTWSYSWMALPHLIHGSQAVPVPALPA